MNLDFEALTDEDVLSVIRRSQVFAKSPALHLQRLPPKPNRADARHRLRFRVWQGDAPVAHLTVGRNLVELHRQTEAFFRANPEVALRPLFLVRHAGVAFLAQDFGGLLNLDEALTQGRISPAEWQQSVRHVANRLRASAENSTPSALLRELAQLETAVLELAALSRLDTIFLRESVFPFLRLEAAKTAPALVWTNGDFVAPNIVTDAEGRPRLIDCEFSRRTHFPDLDWFRLLQLGPRPDGVDPAALGAPVPFPAWLEVLGWLDHAVKTAAVCEPLVAQQDLQIVMTRVALLLRREGLVKRAGLFFDFPAEPAAAPALADAAEDGSPLALEWSHDGSGQFSTEAPVALRPSGWTELAVPLTGPTGRFPQLRLRLPDTPCVLEIRQLALHGRKPEDVVWTLDGEELRQLVACSGAALTVPSPDGVALIHFGGEAVVTLPRARVARRNAATGVTIQARFVPDLQEFAHRLRELSSTEEIGPRLLPAPAIAAPAAGTPRIAVAQLFYPEGPAYTEARSQRVAFQNPGMWEEISFDIPALPAGAVLRFDPVDQAGLIELGEILLTPAPSSLPGEIRSAPVPFPVEALSCEGEAVRLGTEHGIVRLFAFGRDPIAKLPPLPSPLANRPLRVTVNLRWAASSALLAAAGIVRDLRQEVSQLHQRLRGAAEQAESTLREARERADAEARQRLQVEQARADFQAQAGARARELDETRRALQEAQAASGKQAQELADLRAARDAGEAEAARLQAEASARAQDTDTLRQEIAALQAALAAREADAAARETAHAAEVQALTAQAGEFTRREAAAQEQAAAAQARLAALEEDIRQGQERSGAAEARANTLESEARQWRDRAAALEVAAAETRERLAATETRLAGLHQAVEAAQAARSQAEAAAAQQLRAAGEELARERTSHAGAVQSAQALRQEVAARDQALQQARAELEAARQEAAQLRQTFNTTNNDRIAAWKENERLCTQIANHQVVTEALKAAARQRELETTGRLDRTTAELRTARELLAVREAAERQLAEKLRAAEGRAAQLDQELQAARATGRGLEAALREQQAAVARLQQALAEAGQEQARLQAAVAQGEERAAAASAERAAVRALLDEREATLAAREREHAAHEAHLEAEVAAERGRIAALATALQAATGERDELHAIRQQLEAEVTAGQARMAELTTSLAALAGERDELVIIRAQLAADADAAQGRIGALAAEVAAGRALLDETAAGWQATRATLDALDAEAAGLRAALEAREAELLDLQGTLAARRAAHAELEAGHAELARRFEAEETAHAELRTRFGGVVESCHAQNEQLHQFERNVRLLVDEIAKLESRLAEAEGRGRALREAIATVSERMLVKMDRTAHGLLQQAVQANPPAPGAR